MHGFEKGSSLTQWYVLDSWIHTVNEMGRKSHLKTSISYGNDRPIFGDKGLSFGEKIEMGQD